MATASLQRLADAARPMVVPAGTRLFREGDSSDDVYVILDGRVSLMLSVPGRPKVAIGTLADGDLLGWSGLLARRHRVATARTVLESRLLQWQAAGLQRLIADDHELGYHLMQAALVAVSSRLQATRMQLLDMFGHGH